MVSTFIFLPDTLDVTNIGFLEGFGKQFDNFVFYITNDKLLQKTSNVLGYCSEITPRNCGIIGGSKWIHINNLTGKITIQNRNKCSDNITCILYNLKEFKNCVYTTYKLQNFGEYFETLCHAFHRKSEQQISADKLMYSLRILLHLVALILKLFGKFKLVFKYSSTLTHLESNIATVKWVLMLIKDKPTMCLKVRNIIVSKLLDLIFGFIVLLIILNYEQQICICVNEIIEEIIHSLKELLNILMGSPIGLKLNHAFNTTLGIFFFYHISLWRIFVYFIRLHLYSTLYFLLFPASLGLSFQIAIVEDLIKFCTIHVYCIYVYAARLYSLQIYILISLWRLFIGRKYNPLRKRVDSYQYSHHQLFIGTLGCTIFLFLLPTTLLYYVIFAAFRLCLKLLNFILNYLRICFQYLPIYVTVLWLCNSPSVAGTIMLKAKTDTEGSPFKLYVTLKTLPLLTSVKSAFPDMIFPLPHIVWSNILHSLLTGGLL